MSDPVYQIHWQYQWLAAVSNLVLKKEGSLLAWYGGNKDHIVISRMTPHMDFVWRMNYTVIAKTTGNLGGFKVRAWTTPLFWFRKYGSHAVPNKTIIDTVISRSQPSGKFAWQKNEGVLEYYLCAFTQEGDLVLDPFCGEGSVGAVAKRFRRAYLGFEINPKRAETAQKRIDNTQEMAILVEPTQIEMFEKESSLDSLERG